MNPIEDPLDPRIGAYLNVKDRDLKGRGDLFIAEGEVVLHHLLNAPRFDMLSALLSPHRASRLAPAIAAARPDASIFIASPTVLDAIVGFPLHRGVLALGRRSSRSLEDSLQPWSSTALLLVLVGVANHDNMGGLFRNAAAFGAEAVLLDQTSCDPLYRKALRVSVGAALKVPYVRFRSLDDLWLRFAEDDVELIALTPRGREELGDVVTSGRVAAVFGSEGSGLPPAILERCRTVRIQMAADVDSLNVGTAAGIALHHLQKSRRSRLAGASPVELLPNKGRSV